MSEGDKDETVSTTAPPRAPVDFFTGMSNTAVAILVFVLGLVTGFPLATAGADAIAQNLGFLLSVLITLLALVVGVIGVIFVFRNHIWTRLFRRGEIEVERFAGPLADVARYAAKQNVEEATLAARNLAELVLARYAWVSTRRWMVATVTGFIAAIAALAGSALLFQQNQLLRVQSGLLADQTDRLAEQNEMIQYQIELGEAARNAALLPEILNIGALVNADPAVVNGSGRIADLEPALQARIVAATNAARPYRYVRSPLTELGADQVSVMALLRRKDLPVSQIMADQLVASGIDVAAIEAGGSGVLIDRPISPERGQLIGLLYQARLFDTEFLSTIGADLSYAEVRLPILGLMSFRHAQMPFADFSRVAVTQVNFGAANLDSVRFVGATLSRVSFAGLEGDELTQMYPDAEGVWPTRMNGVDFRRAALADVSFENVHGFAVNFDGALLQDVRFNAASIAGSTFVGAVIGSHDFAGTDLGSADFDQAVVFDPDFLTATSAAAEPGRFNAALYRIAPISAAERDAHPMSVNYHLLGDLAAQQAYRISRIAPFGELPASPDSPT